MEPMCVKCGTAFIRKSNRQKMCPKCSPYQREAARHKWRRLTPVIMLFCEHCGTGVSVKRQGRCKTLQTVCGHCKPVIDRTERSASHKWRKKRNKSMSKFGKFCIQRQKENDEEVLDEGYSFRPVWTPSRYVSQEEIDMMKERIVERYGTEQSGIAVSYRTSTYPRSEWTLRKPGYYRVEYPRYCYTLDDLTTSRCHYTQTCSSGLPTAYNHRVFKAYNAYRMELRSAGRERRYERHRKEVEKEEKRLEQEDRMNVFKKSPTRLDASQFFNTLAMASKVKLLG